MKFLNIVVIPFLQNHCLHKTLKCLILGGCKPNPHFVDSKGYNCKQYAEYKWCTSTGGYGEGRKPHETWNFEDFAKDGETGVVCPECGCQGDEL